MPAYIWLAAGCAVSFGIGNSMQKHGMAAVALKMFDLDLKQTIGGFHVSDPHSLLSLLTSPIGWMLIVFSLAGFALFQLSFAHGRISLVGPFSKVFSMVVPVLAGNLALHESLVAWQWFGVVTATVSTFIVGGRIGS